MINEGKKWDLLSKNFLIDNYNKVPISEIAEKLQRTEYGVYRKATKLKLLNKSENVKLKRKIKGYTLDENFFETPNLLNSYWAGFLAADGCIDPTRNRIVFGLSEKDAFHLDRFKNDINFNGKTTERRSVCNISDSIEKHVFYSIEITSKKLCEDLYKNFNISGNKTKKLEPPSLNKNLNQAYCIGFIDGDGSIMNRQDGVLFFSIIALENICEWVKQQFIDIIASNEDKIRLSNIKIIQPKHTNVVKVLKFSNQTYCTEILKYLKQIDVPKLERKWGKV